MLGAHNGRDDVLNLQSVHLSATDGSVIVVGLSEDELVEELAGTVDPYLCWLPTLELDAWLEEHKITLTEQ